MEPVTTGTLIQRSLSVFGSGFTSFTILSLIFFSPIILLKIVSPELASISGVPATGPALLLFFGSILMSPIASAAVVFGVFQGLRGQPATISRCIAVAARRWLAIVGLAILTMIATMLGSLLCILPGIVMACGLFVAGPALIVEKLGPAAAAQRSWDLTDGYKLILFFLSLALFLLQIILGAALDWAVSGLATLTVGRYGLYHALNDIVTIIATAFSAVVAAVAYHDIRVFREGLGEDELVAIFE